MKKSKEDKKGGRGLEKRAAEHKGLALQIPGHTKRDMQKKARHTARRTRKKS